MDCLCKVTSYFSSNSSKLEFGKCKTISSTRHPLEGVKSKKPLYLTPYTIAGQNLNNKLNDAETKYLKDRDFTRELGFDVKYNLTGNLTLDVTLNTDFAQVEADDQQLNLSRFSLFSQKKDSSFKKEQVFMMFPTEETELFYSRRIGLDSDGNPVRI